MHNNNYHAFTAASLSPPTNLRAVTITPTSITLTWEQPEGADAVDRYEISYRYLIEECESEGGRMFPAATVSVNDGTLRRYTLNNSASTPVEEDSLFRITLTAVNSVTRSVPSQPAITTTAEAGTYSEFLSYMRKIKISPNLAIRLCIAETILTNAVKVAIFSMPQDKKLA